MYLIMHLFCSHIAEKIDAIMRQTTCSLVAVETSDRRTLLFTNPHSFRIAHADLERLSSSTSSLSVPSLCNFKRLRTSTFNGSMGGTGRCSNKAIFSRIGKRSPRWWTQVLMSWHAGPLMTVLVTLNRSRMSASWSHCFAISVTSRIAFWHLRTLDGISREFWATSGKLWSTKCYGMEVTHHWLEWHKIFHHWDLIIDQYIYIYI